VKILIATGSYPPSINGIARLAGALSAGLQERGHKVEVISEGSGCRRVGNVALLDRWGREKIDRGADILQVIGPTPLFTEQAARRGRRAGLPVVGRIDSLPGLQTYHDHRMARFVDALYERIRLTPTLRDLDRVIFATSDISNRYPAYRGPFDVIPSGIYDCGCESAGSPSNARDRGGDPVQVRLLFVGQLRPYKGLQYLLDALMILRRDRHVQYTLDLIGQGPAKSELVRGSERRGLSDSVRFLGEVTDEVLHEAYRSHDVLVLPSVVSESFGLVLVEARRHGMAVVATELLGVRELLGTLGGVPVRPRDAASLAEGVRIAATVRPPPVTVDFSRYIWSNIAERYEAVYQRVLEAGDGRFGASVVAPVWTPQHNPEVATHILDQQPNAPP
jgi:glycosyltransferase involved in cell wall biosynthesis